MEFGRTEDGKLEFTFQGPDEVETVAAAYEERNEYLELRGNHSSVHKYDKRVANWKKDVETFRCRRADELIKALIDFVENTEDEVDNILDNEDPDGRIPSAARRYRLSYYASELVQEVTSMAGIEQDPPPIPA